MCVYEYFARLRCLSKYIGWKRGSFFNSGRQTSGCLWSDVSLFFLFYLVAACSPSSSLYSSSALMRPRRQQSCSECEIKTIVYLKKYFLSMHGSLLTFVCSTLSATSSCVSSPWLWWSATSFSTRRSTCSPPWHRPLPLRGCHPPTPPRPARDRCPPNDGSTWRRQESSTFTQCSFP